MLTKVEIDGIDITAKVNRYEIERVYGEAIAGMEMICPRGVNDLMTLRTGLTIEVWRGWITSTDEKIFSGYVEKIEPNAGSINIIAKDKLWDLIRKEVTHTYDSTIDASAGKISEIFKDLVTTYGLLNADGTSIQDSGTIVTIGKFVCNHTDIFERCKKLAGEDWQFYYRADTDKVYFEPKGFTSNSTIIQVGTNVYGIPKWNLDNSEMANDITITGAYQEIETTESGRIGTTAGYDTDGITISYVPISVKVYGDAGSPPTTLKVGGMPDSTATFDYYVDKNQKKIIPKDGTTFTTNDYYEIRYSHAVPIPVHMYSQNSIDLYKQFKKTVTFTDIKSVADAETRGQKYLIKYSEPFIYSTIKVFSNDAYNLNAGQLIQVIDTKSRPNVNKNLVITRQRIRYPADFEELDVGDKIWRLADWNAKIEEKLKRIEEDEFANQDIITELITTDNTLLNPIEIEPRYQKVITQSTIAGEGIWGVGVWGVDKWSEDAFNPEVDHMIQQYQNIYGETFIDTDFKDTCTCTWTGTGSATFTTGQTAISKSVDYNNGTITSVKLTADNSTNLTFQVTANGTDWETTTSGTTHTFSTTPDHRGTDLRWKATASGNATLTNITMEAYH